MSELLTDRFGGDIKGVISCFDRLVLFGSFEKICYPKAMETYLRGMSNRSLEMVDG